MLYSFISSLAADGFTYEDWILLVGGALLTLQLGLFVLSYLFTGVSVFVTDGNHRIPPLYWVIVARLVGCKYASKEQFSNRHELKDGTYYSPAAYWDFFTIKNSRDVGHRDQAALEVLACTASLWLTPLVLVADAFPTVLFTIVALCCVLFGMRAMYRKITFINVKSLADKVEWTH